MLRNLVEKELLAATSRFPKLSFIRDKGNRNWVLRGALDICDNSGFYWDTFEVAIILDSKFPFSPPAVFEVSEKIPRCADRHISPNGQCCLDIEHRLLHMARRGIKLEAFISEIVYPYFANQIYFENQKRFAGNEYGHDFAGVQEFYQKDLKIETPEIAVRILEAILTGSLPTRNEMCPCGKMIKYKKCHGPAVEFLRDVGRERLLKDLEFYSGIASTDIAD